MGQWVGQKIKRTEDPRLVTGTSHYLDDLWLPGLAHAMIVRSLYAHARILSLDTSRALEAPGVLTVLTGNDLEGKIGSVPCAAALPDLKVPHHPVLATGKVRYVGEPVAVVVASDRYAARDAMDLIEVEYEPLDPVIDPEESIQPGAPVLHDRWDNNTAFVFKYDHGDVEKAFSSADKTIRQRIVNQRLIPCAMEPRGVLAQYAPGERLLTLWSSTQIPHLLKTQVAVMLGFPENRLRVITPEVGGGFGSKLNVYGEEALISYLAMQLKRPVKWMESRRENFLGTIHGRGQIADVEMAVRKDGGILGLRARFVSDLGAYHQLLTPAIPTLTGLMLSGPYKIPAIAYEIVGAFTNTVATDAYRGAGRPEATYLLERMMDRAAAELGLDPAEVRRKNFPKREDFPFSTSTGLTYDSGDYDLTLTKALAIADYTGVRKEQAAGRTQGRLLGIGLSSYVEICALGPSAAMPAGGWESATVRVDPTGKVSVLTGASPHGQGQETSFAQIAAEELGVDLADIIVVHGDTGIVQYGIGTFGSRATAVGGTALFHALQTIKEKAKRFAAHLLETEPERTVFNQGVFTVEGDPGRSVTIQQVALAAYTAKSLPPGETPGLEAVHFFEPANFTFPFGTHVAVVEVDPDTGEIEIRRYVAIDDCGRVINPMLVDGQIHGGIVQSLGQALLEEAVYTEDGQLITGEFTDYAIPRAHDVPWLECERTETPTPVNPLGVKGVGEAGTIAATPAIVNAVVDALAHRGVTHIDMPLKPEKIWRLLNPA